MTFEEWWKEMKPAECDELKDEFVGCWEARDAEVERLQRIVESRQAELASCMRANSNKLDTIQRLNEQVTLLRPFVVMLKDYIPASAYGNMTVQEALAATEPKP